MLIVGGLLAVAGFSRLVERHIPKPAAWPVC
jgi:hypothetical protein